jgi:hypothetical protein
VLEFLVRVAIGSVLVYGSLALLVDMLGHPQVQAGLLIIGILLGLLWWAWSQLPEWLRKFVSRHLRRKEQDRER